MLILLVGLCVLRDDLGARFLKVGKTHCDTVRWNQQVGRTGYRNGCNGVGAAYWIVKPVVAATVS